MTRDRVTQKDLEEMLGTLCEKTGQPTEGEGRLYIRKYNTVYSIAQSSEGGGYWDYSPFMTAKEMYFYFRGATKFAELGYKKGQVEPTPNVRVGFVTEGHEVGGRWANARAIAILEEAGYKEAAELLEVEGRCLYAGMKVEEGE